VRALLLLLGLLADTAPRRVPVEIHRLANGLRIVLSRDTTVPLAHVGVYYRVGPREEPEGRAGFAHLFEHLMFEGSPHLGAGQFFKLVVESGGRFGARTLFDVTKYNVTVPSNALERVLWAEADRMSGTRIDSARFENARLVVKNEVRQQAFNRPYGRFAWIDVPEVAQTKWVNAHSIYGDTPDGRMEALDAATLDDAKRFFATYYTPDNAVLVVTGDFDPRVTLGWITKYFSAIPAGPPRPTIDKSEPAQSVERRATRIDPNIARPGLAVAYHMPARSSRDFWTMQVIDQILIEGRDAWITEELVDRRQLVDAVYGGVSARHGTIYTTDGPNFWTTFVYRDTSAAADSILGGIEAQIARLRDAPVSAAVLQRAIVRARADFIAEMTVSRGEGLTDLLGQFTLFDGDPDRVNQIESLFASTTPAMVMETARKFLRPEQRTILSLEPGARR
jgi:predicted Zn-dependent peptidase